MNKILFLIWADARYYQTLIFLAQFFSKEGYVVNIIHRESFKFKFEKKIFGKKISLHSVSKFKYPFIDYFFFYIKYCFYFLKLKPKYIFSFNKKALFCASLLKLLFPNIKLIYHNFDYETFKNQTSLSEKIFTLLESKVVKRADLLIFPTLKRGKIFCKENKIKINQQLVEFKNTFPKDYKPKISNKLKNILKKKFFYKKKIICRLGSIGPNHQIIELVRSVKYWNKNLILILAGSDLDGYVKYIKNTINELQLKNRIFIFTDVTNKFWFEILSRSYIGICFYQEIGISHKNMAGTSQKFNNYIFGNIPFLVNKNKDFKIFNKKYKICSMVNPSRPVEIAKKINNLIVDKKKYFSIKKKLHKLFLNEFNFDNEFSNLKNHLLYLNK